VNGLVSYDYDPVGNRLTRTSTVTGVPAQSSTVDANDRLNSDSYDANGNTTSSNSNTYAYDFENRLTSLNNGAPCRSSSAVGFNQHDGLYVTVLRVDRDGSVG
jgi:hypothetical protein